MTIEQKERLEILLNGLFQLQKECEEELEELLRNKESVSDVAILNLATDAEQLRAALAVLRY